MFKIFGKKEHPELAAELLVLCKEWFEGQIGDLPVDELPPDDEIEQDIIQMRDDTLRRVQDSLLRTDAIQKGKPDDAANSSALSELIRRYSGNESTTPIFTKLALSKYGVERYQSGWPLCTIRLIAETWAEDSGL